jgi:hypothetical protein
MQPRNNAVNNNRIISEEEQELNEIKAMLQKEPIACMLLSLNEAPDNCMDDYGLYNTINHCVARTSPGPLYKDEVDTLIRRAANKHLVRINSLSEKTIITLEERGVYGLPLISVHKHK